MLGDAVKIRQTTISDYLTGKSVPSADVFVRIAYELNRPLEWFLGVESEPLSPDSDSLIQARIEISRLKTKLRKARQTIRDAFSVALDALDLEEDQED